MAFPFHDYVSNLRRDFEKMISENQRLIMRICHHYRMWNGKEAVDDLYQEIVLNMWKGYPKFRSNPCCKQSTWMYRVAINTALMQKRNDKKMNYTSLDSETADSFSETEGSAMIMRLYELIDNLDISEKNIILLYLEGLSHQEMADILGISVTNVGTKIYRIKSKLKDLNEID